MKVVIAGGSGFLGQELAYHFSENKHEVVIFTRGKSKREKDVKFVHWDAKTFGEWCAEMENCEVLINLTGRSVDCRYTEKNKQEIIRSRVDATQVLGEFIALMDAPPKTWLNASTATIYRYSLDKEMNEDNGEIGSDFSMNVAKAWEKAFFENRGEQSRKVALRISLAVGQSGGVYPVLKRLAKFRMAGRMGSGEQRFAWVHIKDLLAVVDFVIENKKVIGPIICASPVAITNAEFMRALRKSLGIKFGFPQPKILLEIGAWLMRTESELILKSRWVYPKRLLEAGFEFKHPEINEALNDLNNS